MSFYDIDTFSNSIPNEPVLAFSCWKKLGRGRTDGSLSFGENKVLCQISLVHLTCSGFYA